MGTGCPFFGGGAARPCGGGRGDDPELSIAWPLKEYGVEEVIATEKDKNWPTLSEYKLRNGIK